MLTKFSKRPEIFVSLSLTPFYYPEGRGTFLKKKSQLRHWLVPDDNYAQTATVSLSPTCRRTYRLHRFSVSRVLHFRSMKIPKPLCIIYSSSIQIKKRPYSIVSKMPGAPQASARMTKPTNKSREEGRIRRKFFYRGKFFFDPLRNGWRLRGFPVLVYNQHISFLYL